MTIPTQVQASDEIMWPELDEAAAAAPSATPYRLELAHPSTPMPTYRLMQRMWERDGIPTLVRWRDQWWRWSGYSWAPVDDAEITRELYEMTEHAVYVQTSGTGETTTLPWDPKRGRIADLLHVMESMMIRSSDIPMPSWTGGTDHGPAVSCLNGLVLLSGDRPRLIPQTPDRFSPAHVECDYRADAQCPQWLAFLRDVLVDDDQIRLLQEWFGYVLSGRIDMHKLMLLIGKPRSGKGTIVHILTALMGARNVASPSGRSFDAQFGLSSLIGKPLGVVPDLRSDRPLSAAATESLLAISSGDSVDIDRKHRPIWTGILPTRMMLLSNESPRFKDASAAVISRCMIIQFPVSFLGREDTTLKGRLMSELSGILAWAIEGERYLTAQGHFTTPAAMANVVESMTHSASPIRAFIDEMCVVDPNAKISTDDLYAQYRVWTDDQGLSTPSKIEFGRTLSAAESGFKVGRPTIAGRQVRGVTGLRLA